MALDFDLIARSTDYSIEQINNCVKTSTPDLFLVNSFLHEDLLEKILYYIHSDSIHWEFKDENYNDARQVSFWKPDTVFEELNMVMENITDTIEKLTNNSSLNFGSSYLWKDISPYRISKHTDRNLIKTSIQIYLSHTDSVDLSTHFMHNEQVIKPVYKTNYGYISNNLAKIEHWMTNDIPDNFKRLSLYTFWQ